MTYKPVEERTCKVSGKKFTLIQRELNFYKKMDLPLPDLCPEERQRRRLSMRNELNLYKRKSDLTGEEILSVHSPDKKYPVYHSAEWFSDKWDPLEYGREYDFNRPFFEQFKELWDEVPKIGLLVLGDNENSDFSHDAYRLKNCYLTFDGEQAFDCMYGETFVLIKNCIDFFQLINSENCYECLRCEECYGLHFSAFCNNCSDSYFLRDCHGCRNCFGCCNLRQKEYHILNKPYSKEEYFKKLKSFQLNSFESLEKIKESANQFFLKFPKKYMQGLMNDNVVGDFLYNSKDCYECYDCANLRDCSYCTNCLLTANDSYDIDIWGDRMSFCYNSAGCGAGAENIIGSFYSGFDSHNIVSSAFCWKGCHDLVGCSSLMHKQYCILNKQYSKEEYEKIFPKIKAHMKEKGEWGQFFPPEVSNFAYNETVANDLMPLSKEEALKLGYSWKEKDLKDYQKQIYSIPDKIEDTEDDILKAVLACQKCQKNYRIEPSELKFYRRHNFPVPRECFHCRHQERQSLKNSRKLVDRTCKKCSIEIKTTYKETQPEIVYCEKCYLDALQ